MQNKIGMVFPIIQCTNNKDITKTDNWQPCIWNKVRKATYEVLDIHKDEKVEDNLDWGGDDGLHNAWTLHYKYPDKIFVASSVADAELTQLDAEALDFSPTRCLFLHSKATKCLANKAERVKTKALNKFSTASFKLGGVIIVPLDHVNLTKVGSANLVGVIVSINQAKSTCQVAVKNGLLNRAYMYHALGAVPTTSHNRATIDLEDIFNGWKGLPKIIEQEAACFISSVGGQGMVKCNCKGKCLTNSCA
jgi:hypothetical protein